MPVIGNYRHIKPIQYHTKCGYKAHKLDKFCFSFSRSVSKEKSWQKNKTKSFYQIPVPIGCIEIPPEIADKRKNTGNRAEYQRGCSLPGATRYKPPSAD